MRFLRAIKAKSLRDRVRNCEIRRDIVEESIRVSVERSRLRWYGHVMRMNEERIPRRMEGLEVVGWRPRGRPRRRWMDEVKMDVEKRGVAWEEVEKEKLWRDRQKWRGLVLTQTQE